jgi:DNA-binding XRE family transcriptional regulator
MQNSPATIMSGATNVLMIECRMALGLTQKEMGNLVGKTKRTVQRWEDRGALLIAAEVAALVQALRPVRPDLAERIAAILDQSRAEIGLPALAHGTIDATKADPIEAVVAAAARAIGVTPQAVRPAVAAAFARAVEEGLDVHTVNERLKP